MSCLGEQMKFLAGLEANGLSWGDGHFGAGAGIAADTCFSWLDREDAEAAEFNTVALDEGSLHAVKDGIHGGFSLGPWQSGAFDNPLDQVLLNHLSEDPSFWIP